MTNHILVEAVGAENSFTRRVQHNPTIAVELKKALERMIRESGVTAGEDFCTCGKHGDGKPCQHVQAVRVLSDCY